MTTRGRIVQARLTPDEFAKFAALVPAFVERSWSALIRTALWSYWNTCQPRTSDNGFIPAGRAVGVVSRAYADKTKAKRRVASRRVKTKV